MSLNKTHYWGSVLGPLIFANSTWLLRAAGVGVGWEDMVDLLSQQRSL